MDGLPSVAAFSMMEGLPSTKSMREVENGYLNMSVAEIAKKKLAETLLEASLSLSNIQNRVLAQMYTIGQAYSQPSLLAQPLTELKAELTHWFDNLPLEWHFPRDLAGAMTIPNPSPDLLVGNSRTKPQSCLCRRRCGKLTWVCALFNQAHLRFKYYVLEFLMCRPILYYIAHESFEGPMDGDSASPGSTDSDGRPFWIYDACHRCLQCAGLMILGNDTYWSQEHPGHRDWFELHM